LTAHRFISFSWGRFILLFLVAALLTGIQSPAKGAAQTESEKLSKTQFNRSYSDHLRQIAEALRYSVVSIDARFTKDVLDPDGSTRTIYSEGNYGSGFIFDREGYVITDITNVIRFPSTYFSSQNPHAPGAQSADYVKVTLYNGDSYQADFVACDWTTGLAVVKMNRTNPDDLQPVVFSDVSDLKVGEPVMILDYNSFTKNVIGGSFGVVAALRGQFPSLEESESQFLQVNFPKTGGNNGGIIIDVFGRVIAMISSYTPYRETLELHYGIPVDIVSKVSNSLISKGVYERPWYGFTLLELNETLKLQESIDFDEGMYVAYVEPNSPAEKAGLVKGDVLYKWDGKVVKNYDVISDSFGNKKVGEKVSIEYFHRDFNVWDPVVGEYTLEVKKPNEKDEIQRARDRARNYL
jgi:S1-C subfamily serine protease